MKHFDYEFIIRKLIAGQYYGEFVSMFQGGGIEKNDVRPYSFGDDAKTINRKLSAKQQSLFVDTFHVEKDALLQVFFDVNANRSAGIDREWGAVVLQYYLDLIVYCLKSGVYVECFLPENEVVVASSIGKDKVKAYRFIQALQSSVLSHKTHSYSSQLSAFVHRMTETSKRRSIVIFSDFLDCSVETVAAIQALRKDHGVYLFRIPISLLAGKHYEQRYTDTTAHLVSNGLLYNNLF